MRVKLQHRPNKIFKVQAHSPPCTKDCIAKYAKRSGVFHELIRTSHMPHKHNESRLG